MHRQRTQFARRVNRVFTHRADRVAKAVERRGIRATYELHDRVLSNRKSRALYEDDRPELDDVQRRVLADVEANGFAVASFGELFEAEGRLARTRGDARSLHRGDGGRPREGR